MDQETIERLLELNRRFYTAFAEPFAHSRPVSDPIVASILPDIPPRARVLDIGCGNGRLAPLLDRERPGSVYVGVDEVPELVQKARASIAPLKRIETSLCLADIARAGWTDMLPSIRFDCAVALAVLHHLPSFDLRAHLLRDVAAVLEPGGRLILSTWQFLASARLRRKIVPWSEVGIAEEELEPGDYLLDWRRGGRGLRYCHLLDEEEIQRLAALSGLDLRRTFRTGARQGNLSLVALLVKAQGS